MVKDIGEKTNQGVLEELVSLDGKYVLDAGCGGLAFTRILVELGAIVLAIDPDSVQAELNRAAPVAGIEFVETGAESIPAEDHSLDGVFFAYSLHHVPADLYEAVFAEVFRALKPNGFLYVIEPIDCPLNQVMMLFHNEEKERAAAQKVLHEIAAPRFESSVEFRYHGFTNYDSFEHFAEHFSNRSFNSIYTAEDVRSEQVREAFERFGAADDYRFKAPKQMMFLNRFKG